MPCPEPLGEAMRRREFITLLGGAVVWPRCACPFIVLFKQERADEAQDGAFVGKDPHHFGAPLDLAVEAFERIVSADVFRLKASTSASASSITVRSPQSRKDLLLKLG